MSAAVEINFDGLVGPTHHYAGLALGNVASQSHAQQVSNPQLAALQGLQKMRLLMQLGVPQAILPPQTKPNLHFLRQAGFNGSPEHIMTDAAKHAPKLLSIAYSASSMWTANAATVTPSTDSVDGKVHITPANLIANTHRSLEWPQTKKLLKTIFADPNYFVHHDALPATMMFADEGAANHTRLSAQHAAKGLHFFVYGRQVGHQQTVPKKFPARQTDMASQTIARLHQLNTVIYAQQNPKAIDAGVFHNDVIAVGNENVLLYHEQAFVDTERVISELSTVSDFDFMPICVPEKTINLEDAVSSYLFNSQLITLPDRSMALIAPQECAENKKVVAVLDDLMAADNSINVVHYVDCRQSMHNGGGPACLRLRVVLNETEMAALHSGVLLTDERLIQLETWVKKHYRDRLSLDDLADPRFAQETAVALTELEALLALAY